MTSGGERRRLRTCPSCWSDRLVRAGKVEGMTIASGPPKAEGGAAIRVPVYANICRDCGMVSLFARHEEAGDPGA